MPMGTTASSARVVAADALTELEKTEEYADEVLSKYLGTSQLRGSDRALAADLYWGTIRWRGRLDSILTPVFHGDYRRADPVTRILLRMGGIPALWTGSDPRPCGGQSDRRIGDSEAGEEGGRVDECDSQASGAGTRPLEYAS